MTDLQEVVDGVLQEMYSRAEPPADFEHIKNNPEEYPDDWYNEHYLPSETQREIVNAHCEMNNLSERERQAVVMNTILDLAPTGYKDDTN